MRERRKEMEDPSRPAGMHCGQRWPAGFAEVLLSKSRGQWANGDHYSSHKMSQVVNACVQLLGH